MPSLHELQRTLATAIVHGTQTSFPGHRLDVYRRTVRANYRKALGATFPVVARLTGSPFFDAAVDAFTLRHPSSSGDLNVYGDRFAAFLAAYPPAVGLPYLPDVARVEWAIDEASRAADHALAPLDVLATLAGVAQAQWAALRFTLHPSCRLLASQHPVLRIWQVNQPGYSGAMSVDFDGGPWRLLVRREADGIALLDLPAGEHAWLAALAHRQCLDEAQSRAQDVDDTFDLATVLRSHIAGGTLIGVH